MCPPCVSGQEKALAARMPGGSQRDGDKDGLTATVEMGVWMGTDRRLLQALGSVNLASAVGMAAQ